VFAKHIPDDGGASFRDQFFGAATGLDFGFRGGLQRGDARELAMLLLVREPVLHALPIRIR
jgi:hypothetical protein